MPCLSKPSHDFVSPPQSQHASLRVIAQALQQSGWIKHNQISEDWLKDEVGAGIAIFIEDSSVFCLDQWWYVTLQVAWAGIAMMERVLTEAAAAAACWLFFDDQYAACPPFVEVALRRRAYHTYVLHTIVS